MMICGDFPSMYFRTYFSIFQEKIINRLNYESNIEVLIAIQTAYWISQRPDEVKGLQDLDSMVLPH